MLTAEELKLRIAARSRIPRSSRRASPLQRRGVRCGNQRARDFDRGSAVPLRLFPDGLRGAGGRRSAARNEKGFRVMFEVPATRSASPGRAFICLPIRPTCACSASLPPPTWSAPDCRQHRPLRPGKGLAQYVRDRAAGSRLRCFTRRGSPGGRHRVRRGILLSSYEVNGELHMVASIRDISERKQAEAPEAIRGAVSQAQKMEASDSWPAGGMTSTISWRPS